VSHPLPASRRWWVLAVLSLTQLVIVLDATIVNIALPDAQKDLGLSDGQRQWVITAYALAFGALLLLGGRVADYWGRKRTFLVGIVGFGVASAVGGIAQNGAELIAARGLLTVTFAAGKERNTAFGVFGAIGGSGAAAGLLLGGVLTQFADWRWCLLVNIVFSLIGLVGGLLLLTESRASGENRYDIAGAITATAGLGSLVYGFTLAEDGWGSAKTLGFLALGLGLLALFGWIESRVAQPLLPLRVLRHRVRGGAFIIQAIVGSVFLGSTLYLTFYFQIVLGMSPLTAGVANVAMTIVILIAFPLVARLVTAVGPRWLMVAGPLLAASGLFYLSRIRPDGDYFTDVLPALILLGLGMTTIIVPLQNLALTGVAPHDAGAAAATVNSAQQIGGSIGLAVFTVIYAEAVKTAPLGSGKLAVLTDGYAQTFTAAAIGMLFAALVGLVFIRGKKEDLLPPQGAEAQLVHAG
jgi:EmrB/QacA subfamily drug resistance transporter